MRKGADKDGPQCINSAGQSHRRDSQHAQVVARKCRVVGCGKALSRSSLWPRTQERLALRTRPVAGCRPRGRRPPARSRPGLCPGAASSRLTGSFQRTACAVAEQAMAPLPDCPALYAAPGARYGTLIAGGELSI